MKYSGYFFKIKFKKKASDRRRLGDYSRIKYVAYYFLMKHTSNFVEICTQFFFHSFPTKKHFSDIYKIESPYQKRINQWEPKLF